MAIPVGDMPREWQQYLMEIQVLQMAFLVNVFNPAIPAATCVAAAEAFYATAWPLIDV